MEHLSFYFLTFLILLAIINIYFRIATKYSIVDVPGSRTLHKGKIIRGGGIVIFFAVLLSLFAAQKSIFFIAAMVLIALISFLDDLIDISSKVRILVQSTSVVMIFLSLDLDVSILFMIGLIISVGFLNAYNFMDGINGITGLYSLVNIASLLFIDAYLFDFIEESFLIIVALALIIFLFYNFRNKARCFCGDVGSVTIAFILLYLTLKLIIASHSILPIFLFTLYGIDTVATIIQRLIGKENIFEAHKKHLFQVLVNKGKLSHLTVSTIYGLLQLTINLVLICLIKMDMIFQLTIVSLLFIFMLVAYVFVKFVYFKVPLKPLN